MASERARRRKADEVPDDAAPAEQATEAVSGHPDRTRTLRAAGARIRYNPNGMRPKGAAARQPWQALSWGYFDDVPEIKAGVYLIGNIMSKVRWFVAVHPDGDPTKEPVAVSSDGSGIAAEVAARADAELARLRADIGGQGEIVRALNMNLEVAAEGYVVGYGAREGIPDPLNPSKTIGASPERWELRSVLEIDYRPGDGTYVVDTDKGSGGVKLDLGTDEDPGQDTCIRIFQRHPAWLNRSDCAMRGLLLDCETVITLTNEVLADSRSRHSAGILLVSEKLTKYHDKLAARDHDGDEAKGSPFLDDLDAALTDPVDDPGTAAAAAPTVVTFPADEKAGDVMSHIRFGADGKDRDLEAKITARAERIGRGMALPPEKIMGHMKTTFANAGQIARDQFGEYVEPRCVLVADALTGCYLRPNLTTPTLEADGVAVSEEDAARMFVWYDASEVIGDADLSGSALQAHGAGLINDEAARSALGYPDTAAPEPGAQLAVQALSRGAISDVMMLAIMGKILGVDLGIDPASLVPAPAAPPIAASARARSRLGDRLTAIDRDLRARLLGAADRSMARVMEKAGNRLAGRAQFRSLVTEIPKAQVAAHLGRAVVTAAGFDDADLVGRFDDLHDLFVQWATTAGDQAVDELARAVGGFDVAARDALGIRQAQSIEEAWAWFERSMIDLAAAKLYDPTAGLEALGEATDLAVPAGLVREALARAGGVTALGTDGGSGVYIAVPTDGTAPSGIATGPFAMDMWRQAGGQVDGYVWDYGPAARSRPFEPHRELDGVTFVNFDDPVLSNDAGFPDTAYYIPGDHTGCVCDVSPIMIAPEEASA